MNTQTIIYEKESNELGVLGFCLMLLGWLTCGILCVPAMLICGIAMMEKPKGLAIAGFVFSVPPVIALCIFAFVFFMGIATRNEAERVGDRKRERIAIEKLERMDQQLPIKKR
jgi:hypothetical protein